MVRSESFGLVMGREGSVSVSDWRLMKSLVGKVCRIRVGLIWESKMG